MLEVLISIFLLPHMTLVEFSQLQKTSILHMRDLQQEMGWINDDAVKGCLPSLSIDDWLGGGKYSTIAVV